MIKAIVLDFGGVLFPVQPFLGAVKPEKEKFNKIKQLVIDIYNENEEKIKENAFTKEDFEKLVREKGDGLFSKEELEAIVQSILVIDQKMLDYIKEASKKYDLYALVNEAPKWTELRAYFHDLDPLFKDYFISSYLGTEKPDPKIFKIFLEKTNLHPEECIFIDDKEENINTAKSLGFNIGNTKEILI